MPRSIILLTLSAALTVAAGACTTRPRLAAAPVAGVPCPTDPISFGEMSPIYYACQVDSEAVVTDTSWRVKYWPPSGRVCVHTAVEFVVDEAGHPVPGSVRVATTNSAEYAREVVRAVPIWRYEPAQKDGRAVPQLVREERTIRFTSYGRTAPPPLQPPANCRWAPPAGWRG